MKMNDDDGSEFYMLQKFHYLIQTGFNNFKAFVKQHHFKYMWWWWFDDYDHDSF